MSYKDRELLTDRNGNPIPQVYDPETGNFKPATDSGTVDISNFPETQKVTDAGVLSELKTLNENNGISLQAYEKATNAETTANEANTKADETVDRVDTIIAGTTDEAEVIDARGNHQLLGDRLNSVDSQLAQKPNKGEITGNDFDISSNEKKLDLINLSDEVHQALTGNAPALAEIPNRAIVDEKIANKAVKYYHTDLFEVGNNLFDKDSLKGLDQWVDFNDGSIKTVTGYVYTPTIKIEPNTEYRNNVRTVVFLDANYDFISGIDLGSESLNNFSLFTTPMNCFYVILNTRPTPAWTNESRYLIKNSIYNGYEPFELKFKGQTEFSVNDNFPFNFGATFKNDDLIKEIVSAVKYIEVYTNDFSKNYGVGIIQRSYSSYGTGIYISEFDNEGNFVKHVSNVVFSDANIVSKFTTKELNGSGVTAKVLMDWSKITDGKQYVFNNYSETGIDPRLYVKKEVQIVLPPKVYGVVGEEINVYFDNVILCDNLDNYSIDVVCQIGKQQNERWTGIPDTATERPLNIHLYKNGEEVDFATTQLIITDKSVSDGLSKKAIMIGDSTTNDGSITGMLVQNFSEDVMNLELLGTRGTAPNLHEGRPGWTTSDYVSLDSKSGTTNPFWNPTTNSFDFNYYMTEQGYSGTDYVFINLGINDIFVFTDDETLNTEIVNILSRMDSMVSSIHAYDSTIKVGIAVIIPPSRHQDSFGNNYSSGQTRDRYFRNYFLFIQSLINHYKGKETEGVHLIPLNVNIDTVHNMQTHEVPVNSRNSKTVVRQSNGVHPSTTGYHQEGDSFYYAIKSLVV